MHGIARLSPGGNLSDSGRDGTDNLQVGSSYGRSQRRVRNECQCPEPKEGIVSGSLRVIATLQGVCSLKGFPHATQRQDIPIGANGLRNVPLERRHSYVRRQRCLASRILLDKTM